MPSLRFVFKFSQYLILDKGNDHDDNKHGYADGSAESQIDLSAENTAEGITVENHIDKIEGAVYASGRAAQHKGNVENAQSPDGAHHNDGGAGRQRKGNQDAEKALCLGAAVDPAGFNNIRRNIHHIGVKNHHAGCGTLPQD